MFAVVLAYPKGMGLGDVKLTATMGLFLGRAIAPALFVAGIPDGICAHSRELLDRHAVRWLGLEPAGHWVHADQLDAFATGVAGFLREV